MRTREFASHYFLDLYALHSDYTGPKIDERWKPDERCDDVIGRTSGPSDLDWSPREDNLLIEVQNGC